MNDSFKFQVSRFKSKMKSGSNVRCPKVRANFGLWTLGGNDYAPLMALARILVDGYSLLHNWPELAPGRPRHSARAREELVHVLTRYHDATGTPVTVFFDGSRARRRERRRPNRIRRLKFCFRAPGRPPIK
jgi:hypothetical protein